MGFFDNMLRASPLVTECSSYQLRTVLFVKATDGQAPSTLCKCAEKIAYPSLSFAEKID